MEALLLVIMGAYGVACFIIGARVGQKVVKGEPIELPKVNLADKMQEHRARKEADKQQEWKEAVLRNIEAYDGTAQGQKDVPGG